MTVSRWLAMVLAVSALQVEAMAAGPPSAIRFFEDHLAPLRSNAFRQVSTRPCGIGVTHCFSHAKTTPKIKTASRVEREVDFEDPSPIVFLELRTAHHGPWVHHWIETETRTGRVTIGFGPATLPFIDAGQVALQDEWGNVERISGMHPLPPLGMPPLNYRYARAPGDGWVVGKPVALTMAQSEAIVQHIRHERFIVPYIPFFHDCRTFTCTTKAKAQGRSSLPCYFLFKGYW